MTEPLGQMDDDMVRMTRSAVTNAYNDPDLRVLWAVVIDSCCQKCLFERRYSSKFGGRRQDERVAEVQTRSIDSDWYPVIGELETGVASRRRDTTYCL